MDRREADVIRGRDMALAVAEAACAAVAMIVIALAINSCRLGQ